MGDDRTTGEGISPPELGERLLDALRAEAGTENVVLDVETLEACGTDESHIRALPAAVVRAIDAEQIERVVKLANRERFPVVARGGGTGMTGGAVPVRGGVVIDLTGMDRIIEVRTADLTAILEPGVKTIDLQHAVQKHDLMYPPDPASVVDSTIGGNVAENAGGLRGLKYGVTADYVLALKGVTGAGEPFEVGRATLKSVTGYDMTRLLVGSEGTLAIFTEITVRLLPLPPRAAVIIGCFHDVASAIDAVTAALKNRLLPRAMEFVDRTAYEAVRAYMEVPLPEDAEALLFMELDGTAADLQGQVLLARKVAEKAGAYHLDMAFEDHEREKIWEVRREVTNAIVDAWAGRVNEDICVPRSKMLEMHRFSQEAAAAEGLGVAVFGHAGDGNLHVNILGAKRDAGTLERAHRVAGRIFAECTRLGGTLTGEHGVGLTKMDYMRLEVGETEMRLMREIKRTFDPNDVLNPGKMFPEKA